MYAVRPIKNPYYYFLHFAVSIITDFCCCSQVLDEFSKQVDSIDWPSGNPETINYKALDIHLSKYQVSVSMFISTHPNLVNVRL